MVIIGLKHLSLRLTGVCAMMFGFMFILPLVFTLPAYACGAHDKAQECPSVLQHKVQLFDSVETKNLCHMKGKALLVVNIASGCGFTPQLEGLEALHQKYKEKGLVVMGFPSNSFYQELLEDGEIASFCKMKYGVTFPITAKTPVKGEQAHPLFAQLAEQTNEPPKWNFFKYLIGTDGEVLKVFPSTAAPDSEEMISAIEAALMP